MSVLKTNPEMMSVVINIQTMKSKINPLYNSHYDFQQLIKKSVEELYNEQDSLITEYNKTFNK